MKNVKKYNINQKIYVPRAVLGRFFLNHKFLESRVVEDAPFHEKYVLLHPITSKIRTDRLVFRWTYEEAPGVVCFCCDNPNYTVIVNNSGGETKGKIVRVDEARNENY